MITKIISGGLLKIDTYVIEVDMSLGLPVFVTVGLPDGAIIPDCLTKSGCIETKSSILLSISFNIKNFLILLFKWKIY